MILTAKTIKALVFILIFSILAYFQVKKFYLKNKREIEVVPFKVCQGWGYDILINSRTFIHQPTIPAIEGNKPFYSKKDAKKTGILVAEKIKKGHKPTIKKKDLDSLKVKCG
ncbi:MAG: DUF4907 domain-containing protein [Bacteroidales bacterium]